MPKLYTAIDIHRGSSSYRINPSWQGSHWGNFHFESVKPITDLSSVTGKISGEDDHGILAYRCIPKVGWEDKGQAEAEYPVFVPHKVDFPQPQMQRVWQSERATFKIDALDRDCLPTLHHVVDRLQQIPVYEIVGAKVVEVVEVPDVGAARRIG